MTVILNILLHYPLLHYPLLRHLWPKADKTRKDIIGRIDILLECIDIVEGKGKDSTEEKCKDSTIVGKLTPLLQCRKACKYIRDVRNRVCHNTYMSKIDKSQFDEFEQQLDESSKIFSEVIKRLI